MKFYSSTSELICPTVFLHSPGHEGCIRRCFGGVCTNFLTCSPDVEFLFLNDQSNWQLP